MTITSKNDGVKRAKAMLLKLLAKGPILLSDILKETERQNISESQLRKAKKDLNILSIRVPAVNDGSLPYKRTNCAKWKLGG